MRCNKLRHLRGELPGSRSRARANVTLVVILS